MLEPHAPEIRQELAAARLAALHRSAASASPRTAPPGRRFRARPPRAATGIRGQRPAARSAAWKQRGCSGFEPGTHTRVSLATESDLERELAAPFGIRVARPQNVITLRIPS